MKSNGLAVAGLVDGCENTKTSLRIYTFETSRLPAEDHEAMPMVDDLIEAVNSKGMTGVPVEIEVRKVRNAARLREPAG